MKRTTLFLLLATLTLSVSAQIQVNDTMYLFLDSLFMELPEVMVTGERPIVKAEEGKLVYDLPRLVGTLPVDNAYDAIKELPGVVDMGGGLTLAGKSINIVIDGKVSTLTYEQLTALLKTIPVARIEKAEVMYSAPARYQVRGPMINIVLKREEGDSPKLQGELFTSLALNYYERLTERASLLYASNKFSADLLYSFKYGRQKSGIDKEAVHTVDGIAYPLDQQDVSRGKGNTHNIRLGMDYKIAKDNLLSLVYTTQLSDSRSRGVTTGTEQSTIRSESDDRLHNLKLDYQSSFGTTAGAEFTFYTSPGNQELHSILNDEAVNARYDDQQRINKWRFYITQNHALKNGWGINYGVNYTTALDNSFQNYYDTQTCEWQPDKSMKTRKREYTANGFAGFNKSFGTKLSLDASLAAELYHTNVWDDWMFYPALNMSYVPAPGHILQLAFSSDKSYPSFWSTNNSVAYTSAYTEIHGNLHLKPYTEYQASLTYIYKGKYVLTAYYSHKPDYSTQVPYQRPDRLVEVYKYFNFDYQKQTGIQAIVPFNIKNRLNSRLTVVGYYQREKNSDFWDIPFDRSAYSFIVRLNNSLLVSTKPNIRFTLSGFYQNGMIQGIYDLSRSGSLDTSLQWTFAGDKAQLTLKGTDLLETSNITPKIRFKGQNTTNRFTTPTRTVEVSFSYKFGDYKERKREGVDRSRFK